MAKEVDRIITLKWHEGEVVSRYLDISITNLDLLSDEECFHVIYVLKDFMKQAKAYQAKTLDIKK